MQDRKRIAERVPFRPANTAKTQMFIKPDSLIILFVDIDRGCAQVVSGVFDQTPARALAPPDRMHEEHFYLRFDDGHEREHLPVAATQTVKHPQAGNRLPGDGDQFLNILLREKAVSRPHRGLPDLEEPLEIRRQGRRNWWG